jgi:ATP-binding cassette subfamily C (CFTR/MRP) protein 1
VIKDGTFSWTDDKTTLEDINFSVKTGELVAVVGTIGAGKSSLLCSLLGDLKKDKGVVNTKVGQVEPVEQKHKRLN